LYEEILRLDEHGYITEGLFNKGVVFPEGEALEDRNRGTEVVRESLRSLEEYIDWAETNIVFKLASKELKMKIQTLRDSMKEWLGSF